MPEQLLIKLKIKETKKFYSIKKWKSKIEQVKGMNKLVLGIIDDNPIVEEEKLEIEHLEEFREETIEILERIEDILISFEGKGISQEKLKEIFRGFHSIKGISGFASQTLIETISHQTESVLTKLQNGIIDYDITILEILINSVELIKQICKDFKMIKDKKFNEIIKLHLRNIKNINKSNYKKIEVLNDFAFENQEYIKIPIDKMENFFIFISSFKETVNQINCDNVDYSKEKLNKEIQKIETYVNRFKEEEIEFLYKKLKKIALYTLKTVQIEAKLTFEGGEIKAEKILLNKLFIPFSQIIRNAIIHGLLYKEGERVIKIKAEKINDVLYFYFENNGEAIDKKVIKKKLLEKNIKFLDEDIVNAIFLPNFSTKSEEDLFSGRGIGLDLVKNEIDKLKGKISVFSEKEMGTVFSIEIPSKRKNYQEVAYE